MWFSCGFHVALIKLHTQLNHDDKRPIMIRIGMINMDMIGAGHYLLRFLR